MNTTARYLKRYRMVLDFRHREVPHPELPEGFRWIPWAHSQLEDHARIKHQAFEREFDSRLFPSLGTYDGCRQLLTEICRHRGFLPAATWMVQFAAHDFGDPVMCGVVQGIVNDTQQGAIQNIGILPEFRGLGLGRALLLKSLSGFRRAGTSRVYLEVTAGNGAAVGLYESVGFQVVGTRYRELPVEMWGELKSADNEVV